MLQETREKLIARGLNDAALNRLEKFPDEVIERNLALAEKRHPRNLAGFLIAACESDFAAPTPPTVAAPPPATDAERRRLERRLREFKAERRIILETPRVMQERLGLADSRLTDWEKARLALVEKCIAELEVLLGKRESVVAAQEEE